MKVNKAIEQCLREHYSKDHKSMARIDIKVRCAYNKIVLRHSIKGERDKEALLILATLDKIGLDNIIKAKIAKL